MASPDRELLSPEARAIARSPSLSGEGKQPRLIIAGGLLGALAVSACCILPEALISLGLGGAWIGNLTALAPYKPLFAPATVGTLGFGFLRTYRKPKRACAEGNARARCASNTFVKLGLWAATILAAVALAFDTIAPLLLGA